MNHDPTNFTVTGDHSTPHNLSKCVPWLFVTRPHVIQSFDSTCSKHSGSYIYIYASLAQMRDVT